MLGEGATQGSPVRSNAAPRSQPRSSTTRSRAPMPNASLNSRASSPIVMPWRTGIG
jgi:hypothetical protein